MRGIDLSPQRMNERVARVKVSGFHPSRWRPKQSLVIGGKEQRSWATRMREEVRERVKRETFSLNTELPKEAHRGRLPIWSIALWAFFLAWAVSWLLN